MTSADATTLIHVIGFVTGIALYAMLGAMTLRNEHRGGVPVLSRRGDRIPVFTALLGLLWNCGALVIYGFRDFGVGTPAPLFIAVAFSALGFLPAVVVHSALQAAGPRSGARALTGTAYSLSTVATFLQIRAAVVGAAVPARAPLLLLTTGYAVIIALIVVYSPREPAVRHALSAVALAAFSVMALHLSQHAQSADSWPMELVGHHASLPLALVILYQDYRFALADLFLKRLLTLLVLIAIWMAQYVWIAVPFVLPRIEADHTQPLGVGLLLMLGVATAMAYPALRRWVGRFVDRVVLRRADYQKLLADIAKRIEDTDTADSVLSTACAALGPALSAREVSWREIDSGARTIGGRAHTSNERGHGASVTVPTADPPAYEIGIGHLTGGRRILSDDLALLDDVALAVARRLDTMRMTRERYARDLREREILQLATEAELRALRAQLNPHFLFNALTTIGHLIQEAPDRALDTLLRLTKLLRAVLKRSDGDFVTLAEELEIVRAYLAIESARFEERLNVTIDVPEEIRDCRIPPLLLQPLVENAIKHGIAPHRSGGRVVVAAQGERDDADDGRLAFLSLSVIDTGMGVSQDELERRRGRGIGLSNIVRRLERYYGDAASIEVRSAPGVGTTVRIRVPVGLSGTRERRKRVGAGAA